MKRSPIGRKTPMARTRKEPLARTRMKAAEPSRRARPDVPLADRCEAWTPVCTGGRAEQRHHVLMRSQGGGDGDTIDVTSACHGWIHANQAVSYEQGWLRHATPRVLP